METLEHFCVIRNITFISLARMERLSRFNDLCGCSIILLFLANFFYKSRIVIVVGFF